jgi:hypothetical protein
MRPLRSWAAQHTDYGLHSREPYFVGGAFQLLAMAILYGSLGSSLP